MRRQDAMILGANHQFLYLEGLTNPEIHATSLASLVKDPRIDAVDCWVCAKEPYRTREIETLRACDKAVNYNIGDRHGDPVAVYAAAAGKGLEEAWAIFQRELDLALASGAKKIVMGSGPDFPGERPAATARLADFCARACAYVGPDIMLTIEPTDRDVDKRFLLGPLEETVALIETVRARGHANFGMLLDMGHVPIMHETIEAAVKKAVGTIEHIHLGNALIKDPTHPLYGDKHVPWEMGGCEYGYADVVCMIRALREIGYFGPGKRPTVTFEMRPCEDKSPEDSLGWFIEMLDRAWEETA